MPEGGRSVARPTRWGNPIKADPARHRDKQYMQAIVAQFRDGVLDPSRTGSWAKYPTLATIKAELRGRALGCFCPLDTPCHADVLIDIANS